MLTQYFLGANSPRGFYSLYDGFIDPKRDTLRVIKSGPGSGKSTFMRMIAEHGEKKGFITEIIRCSGDPDSLDGVYFPEKGVAYVDGTSPHVTEPVYSGSGGIYVDLSRFYDIEGLRREHEAIVRLTGAYKDKYRRAYGLIESAKACRDAIMPVISREDTENALRRLGGILSRELPESGKTSTVTRRLLGAITCRGYMELYGTVEALADKVYLMDNDLGLGFVAAERAAEYAESAGWDTVRLMSWSEPGRTEGVIVPELRLAFISADRHVSYEGEVHRRLRLDSALSATQRADGKRANKLSDLLLGEAEAMLRDAKSLHDRLEERYNPHVDFDGVRSLAMSHASELFG